MSFSATSRVLTMIAAGATLVSVMTIAPASAIDAPTLLSPAFGESVATNTPTLSWDRLATATKYDVWVDDNPDFTSANKFSTTNSRLVMASPLANGSQFWQVRAYAGSVIGGWNSGSFSITQHAGPDLSSPSDGAVLNQPSNPPVMTWAPIGGAASYALDVATDDAFTQGLVHYTTKTTSFALPDQNPDGTYFWRVKATYATSITSLWSATRSFVIGPLAQVTNPVASDDDTHDTVSDTNNLTFDWDPVPGAASYQIIINSDPTALDASSAQTVVGTRYSPSSNLNLAGYYWKVRAVNADGKFLQWSQVTRQGPIVHEWLDQPVLVYPNHPGAADTTITTDPFYLQWTPVAHATEYEVMVSASSTFTNATKCVTTASTTYTIGHKAPGDPCDIPDGAKRYWQVRAVDAPKGLFSNYNDLPCAGCQPYSFTYRPSSRNPVIQTSPANGAVVDVPALEWAPVPNTETYKVTVTPTTGSVVNVTTHSNRAVPELTPANGPFTWTVTAIDANGNSSMTPLVGPSFTLNATVTATGTPLAPIDGVGTNSARFPLLRWQPLAAADHYKVCIGAPATSGPQVCDQGVDDLNSASLKFPAAVSTDDGYFAAGDYDWSALAYDDHDVLLAAGPVATIHITSLDATAGTRIGLSGQALDAGHSCATLISSGSCMNVPATPVFAWDDVSEASYYKVFVATDSNLQQMVYDDGHDLGNQDQTVNTYWTPFGSHNPEQLPDSTAGPFYWYVLPCKSKTSCNLDPHGRPNVTTNAFFKLSPKVTGLTETVTDNDVTFHWDDYLATNLDLASAWLNEQPYQTARQYTIQISPQESFPSGSITATSGTLSATVDQTTFTPYSTLLPDNDTLFWRVQAIDPDGHALPFSDVRQFAKVSPTVTNLATPTNGSTVDGTTPLSWSPITFAVDYRISIFSNDTGHPVSGYPDTTNGQSAYTPSTPLPTSSQPYLWQLERKDAAGRWGKPSALSTFYVRGATPTQVSPAAGATVNANDVYFQWNAVDSAYRYQVDYQKIGTSGPTSTTTSARELALTSILSTGSYQWRVIALDAGGKILTAAPAWRPLTIIGATTTTTGTDGKDGQTGIPGDVAGSPRIVKLTPGNRGRIRSTGSFTVKFNEPVTGVSTTSVFMVKSGSRKHVRVRLSLNSTRTVLTIKPSARLKRHKKYKMSLTTSIKDLARHSIKATSWTVTVR